MDTTERFERGMEKLIEVDGEDVRGLIAKLAEASPGLAKYVVEFPFGDIYSRPELSLREREIATLASLVTLRAEPQLRVHVRASLNVGLTREEIMETILHMAVYAGFPAAISAAFTAKEVFDELETAAAS